MDLLHRLYGRLIRFLHERETYRALARLDDRELADLGLHRADLRAIARDAARAGRLDVFDWVATTRGGQAGTEGPASRLVGFGLGLRAA
ncbi:DUF1127 domain-containing protein [Benzoatithermus flavus]|uniref:DUF1127 domain-containing protein n=1 Tax=Benzoatithermus flavus TaxID=3108223 RepID=A0ABU8XQE5_9PROT